MTAALYLFLFTPAGDEAPLNLVPGPPSAKADARSAQVEILETTLPEASDLAVPTDPTHVSTNVLPNNSHRVKRAS